MNRFTLHHGDSREILKGLPDASAHSVVCDPPYELGFMGKSWDNTGIAYDPVLWSECLRVAKPGAFLLAFGGTRTFHRLACAIEDAGWELRDTTLRGHMPRPEDCPWLMAWGFGSGFPKSKNPDPFSRIEDRREFTGWGTAQKPAWEPIVMARKPLAGTVLENMLIYGTGALNIDGCRVEPQGENDYTFAPGDHGIKGRTRRSGFALSAGKLSPIGRWPANLIHDGSDEVVALFPADAPSGGHVSRRNVPKSKNAYGDFGMPTEEFVGYPDAGSAARFFYCAKASQEDRNEGCSGLPERPGGMVSNTSGQHITRRDGGAPGPRANHHPTVKPTDLMAYLCRLVTPKGGTVLDPFMGSGSTGKAAMLEGFNFIGIDLTAEYVEIARARIRFALRQGHQPSLDLEAA